MPYRQPGQRGPGLRPWLVGRGAAQPPPYLALPTPEPTLLARKPYIPDLPVNCAILALLAAQAAIVSRPPLIVNRPWARTPQVEQVNNRAVHQQTAGVTATRLDAQSFKRASAAVDVFPNLAVAAVVAAPQTPVPAPLDLPLTRRYAPQVDVFANIAVNFTAANEMPAAALETQVFRKAAPQLDAFANIAVQFQSAIVSAPPDWQATRPSAQPPQLYPNLAVRAVAVATMPPPWVEPTARKVFWQLPQLHPNLAATATPAETFRPAPWPIEPQLAHYFAPPVLGYPNIAVAFDNAVTPPLPPDFQTKPAGRKKKKRYEVEIDGQVFEVDSVSHAAELLARAHALALKTAPLVVEAVAQERVRTNRPVHTPTPLIQTHDPQLLEVVRAARARINDVYRQAALHAELRLRLNQQQEEDDDEDDILLLL